ncbi:MAG: 3-isopropylmalate dehydratase small subunit [bacterium]|nr:3-isopropylmalate dehydratase small subunit [bacterium]MCP4966341.1 3-isopropylmalate dehydratase small subunit [bacterium]
MEAISVITGQMAPLPRANVDTDAIIPKQFLKRVERSGFGPFLFYEWAYDEEGELIEDFILNQPAYAAAKVLVSGPNFGSGSSREHAPWSIEDRGFAAVIAPSFADIFHNNCINIGLLPVVLTDDEVARLTQIAEDPDNLVTIDLEDQTVTAVGFDASFDIDPFAKHRLANGLDNIALALEHADAIASYESTRAPHKPAL